MLAIVIPYYNIAFFERTLYSLSHQSDKRFKVYIGNNNSPDDPLEIIEGYKPQLDIFYKKFDNSRDATRLSEQFEQCVSMLADEEWFMLLGDDDMLEPDVVADFYKNLPKVEKEGINVIKYATVVVNKYDELISGIYKYTEIENAVDLYVRKLKNEGRSSLSEQIFRTSQFHNYKIPYSPVAWHTDDMMILQYAEFGAVFCISDSIVVVRMSDKNISGNGLLYAKEKTKANILFFKELLTVYREKFNEKEIFLFFKHLVIHSLREYSTLGFSEVITMGIALLGLNSVKKLLLEMYSPSEKVIEKAKNIAKKCLDDIYMDTFCFCKNKALLEEQFLHKQEFRTTWIYSESGDIAKEFLDEILQKSLQEEDDLIILCTESHCFDNDYGKKELLECIYIAYFLHTKMVFGGGEGIDFRCEIYDKLNWINRITDSSFIILFHSVFSDIIDSTFDDKLSFCENLSELSSKKMVIYPPISKNSNI